MDTIKEKEAFENIDIADDFWEINHSFIDSFTDDFGDDIIKDNNNPSLVEDKTMLSRYHFHNTIYLYGIFDSRYATAVTSQHNIHTPVKLYETPEAAKKSMEEQAKNAGIKDLSILRFAVDIGISTTRLGYDALIPETEQLLKQSKLSKEKFKEQCGYIREYDSKLKQIVYTINDKRRILNVQDI